MQIDTDFVFTKLAMEIMIMRTLVKSCDISFLFGRGKRLNSKFISWIGLFRILGIELELACNRGSCGAISHANILMIFPRMSFHCKLVPVQYREYVYGLLWCAFDVLFRNRNSSGVCVKTSRCSAIWWWDYNRLQRNGMWWFHNGTDASVMVQRRVSDPISAKSQSEKTTRFLGSSGYQIWWKLHLPFRSAACVESKNTKCRTVL